MQHVLWAPLTAFAAALWIVWWLTRSRISAIVLDRPNPRSLHETPVPRTGGIGLHIGLLLALFIVSPKLPLALWAAFGLLLVISLLDDLRGVPAPWRLSVHLLAAGWFALSVLLEQQGPLAAMIAAFAIAWMANLYNFMDGSDGLAGGMTVIGFTFYGIAAWFAGHTEFALVNFSIAAAAAGFLFFNFHPARVFMGDVGSVPLGFLAGALGVVGWLQGDWALWFPVLVFSPFIVDATVTLARRLWRRERVWEAHRDHYYQRLVQLGWGHRRTALAEYGLMLACGLLGLAVLPASVFSQALALATAALAYALLIAALELRWRRRNVNGEL